MRREVIAGSGRSPNLKPGVRVTDGLFSIELDVTQDDFDGQALWLEVEVGGTAIGCREILPVPNALSLRPGARIIGGAGLHVESDDSSWLSSAVYGSATSSVEETIGIHGRTHSDDGRGVFGLATAESGSTLGAGGVSESDGGTGVWAQSSGSGLSYGRVTAVSGTTYGVDGRTYSDDDQPDWEG